MKRLTILIFLMSSMSYGQKIFNYIEKGNTKKVEQYIKKHDVIKDTFIIKNEKDFSKIDEENFIEPIGYAVIKNKFDIVKLFVKDSLKIPNFREQLSVAFALSMSIKNDTLSNYLYNLNPDLSAMCLSCHQHSAIMIATVYGNEKWYYKLKEQTSLTTLNNQGRNLLHLSMLAEFFSESIFNDLLQLKDIDKSLNDNKDKTPLNYAASSGNEYAFFKLLDANAEFYHYYTSYNSAWVDGSRSGSTVIFNYIEKNISKGDVWNESIIPFDETMQWFYPLEFSISSNSIENTIKIYERMLVEIKQTKDENLKKERIGIVYMILNNRLLSDGDWFLSLMESIWSKNKKMFEFLLIESQKLNELELSCIHINNDEAISVEDIVNITIQKWEYKAAKQVFGENYVDSLFLELNIVVN